MVGLAMVHRERKKFDEAEKLLDKVLDAEPGHVLARYTLAGIYEEKRELDKAIVEWKKLLDLPGEGEDADRGAPSIGPISGSPTGSSGKRDDESLQAFEKANGLAKGEERYEVFYLQALLAADRPKDAQEFVRGALERHPDSARLRLLETRILDANGKSEEALQKGLGAFGGGSLG